ncbi:MAG: DUF3047 domain-containing protein [Myxococcales bacterium]|jgi:hypothetical protein|nr:DUF3047 domain-containing protein [Myxococcales bacterium]MCH8890900.1 DUF3047 domain-containing protein [Myxococcales bacterium]
MAPRLGCAFAIALVALAGPIAPRSAGVDEIPLPTPGSGDWRPLVFRGIANQTRYTLETFEGMKVAKAESGCGASGLVLRPDAIRLDQTPLLSWRWRVDRGLDVSEEQTKAGDDFAARVYLLFELDKSRASTLQRLRHRLAKLIYGEDIPGSALNFVWTSRLPVGTVWDNPFEPSSKMIALAQGANTGWRRETVDVVARYRELFGTPIPRLLGLAIMSDSDNSCQRTEARFADFKFLSPAEVDEQDAE